MKRGPHTIRHPSMTYLTQLSPAQADGLLIALEALKDYLWAMHGEAIETACCEEEDFFSAIHTETPDFLKEKIK